MTVSNVIKKMIEYSGGNCHDINHFLKVWAFAKTIGELEQLDEPTQLILEIVAIIHDIACPLCREKYGNTDGKHQEEESAPLVRAFLRDFKLEAAQVERVVYLVCHHHTYTGVDGPDYQILLEADYLVNAEESAYPESNIQNASERIFQTAAGTQLLRSMFLK